MTCSFAMRRSRKLLFDAGLNRNTRPRASQTTDVRGSGAEWDRRGYAPSASPADPPPPAPREAGEFAGAPAKPALETRQPCALVDFLGAAGAARAGRRGLGAAVAVGPVVRKGQRRLYLELVLQPRAALFPSLLVLELVFVQRGRLLDAV